MWVEKNYGSRGRWVGSASYPRHARDDDCYANGDGGECTQSGADGAEEEAIHAGMVAHSTA